MEYINVNEIFNIIEDYLFAFSSRQKALKEIFPNGIENYITLSKDELKEIINNNLLIYFNTQFKNKKLVPLFKKYISTNGIKHLNKNSISFFDNIIIGSKYEPTFEDLSNLYNMKIIKNYINSSSKDNSYLMDQLRDYIFSVQMSEDDEESTNTSTSDYFNGDIYTLYKKDFAEYKVLTPEMEKYYLKKYLEENDKEAQEELIKCNQALIIKVAKCYMHRGLEFLDLIQEGNIGLMSAIQNYKPELNTKLSTYAMFWIRQRIKYAIHYSGSSIRIPMNMREEQDKLSRIERDFKNKYGKDPTIEQLIRLTGFSEQKIENLKKYTVELVSFNKTVSSDEDKESELGDFISSTIESPTELAESRDVKEAYDNALRKLGQDTREKNPIRMEQVVRLRSCIDLYNDVSYELIRRTNLPIKENGYTLEETGKIFGLTPERIRQIESRGRRKLSVMLYSYDPDNIQKALIKKRKIKE
ncbi:MAG: sigma-70 family RNA polymerase sigma factor [Bacilli bacterium]|nr:sigma-70 family RNA polymerase sigma factor [Bacilli bacterium]